MIISLIVAVSQNNVIGKNNQLPWRMPADMKYFKDMTMGHCVITGRKNFDSIPEKFRPLAGRTNIVITRNKNLVAPGVLLAHTLEDGIRMAKEKNESECFIIGGGEIFRQALHLADKVYLTRIHHPFDGDVFFPEINTHEWTETARTDFAPDEKNKYSYSFITFEHRK